MDRGRMLADATNVLVQVSGGAGMTLSEVEVLMQELGRHVNEQTQILFGAVVDGKLGDRLAVTIISSLAADEDLISESRDGATLSNVFAQPPVREQHPPPQIHIEPEAAMEPVAHEESISFESNRWRPKQHQPLNPCQANPSRYQLRHTRKRFHIPTRKPPQNPFQQNRKFCNSSPSRADDLKKANRPSSKAKISTCRPICGKTSR
ncbi:MAG: hypothetical protein DMF33_00100 [Verrucomicrobia bacterium]|nr:MAG: hypothetical protein DMF33_00100 [Verrucomicrobiota bacterium]